MFLHIVVCGSVESENWATDLWTLIAAAMHRIGSLLFQCSGGPPGCSSSGSVFSSFVVIIVPAYVGAVPFRIFSVYNFLAQVGFV